MVPDCCDETSGHAMQFELIKLNKQEVESSELVKSCFALWLETYAPIVESAGKTLEPSSFFNNKILSVIHDQGLVLSFACNNMRDLSDPEVRAMPYFARLSDTLMGRLKDLKIFTVEWVTVNPEHRAKVSKVQQADLIMSLGIRSMAHSPCDAAIGFSRTDLKADRIAERSGGRAQEYVNIFNIECAVMLALKSWVTGHKYQVVQDVIDELWLNKINQINEIENRSEHGKAA